MTIGEKLKKSRNDKGMSLRELATKVELSASFLSQIEQGKASPSIENLKKIAHTLDVRVAYLIEDEEDDIRNIEHIKKENIGLIEVMGLAVLPGRLKFEMRKIAEYLKDEDFEKKISDDKDTEKHLTWLKAFINKYSNIKNLSVDEILENILNVEIGLSFSRVLEDAGVFKRDEKGKNAFLKFINHIGGRF